jgi:Tfp pilus assembly protein PilE
MAGVEFDRQAFIPSTPQGRSAIHLLVPLAAIGVLALVAFVGYKAFLVNTQNNEAAAASTQVQQLEQQVAELQKRLDGFEKHRKGLQTEASTATAPVVPAPVAAQPSKTVYQIKVASSRPAQTKTAAPAPAQVAASTSPGTPPEIAGEVAANREAWEATTNRLADVVGVVGTQQGELSETRDAVNQLLAQTRREAVSFEVNRHADPVPVGPVTLQFKSVDAKGQLYTLCVFFNSQKCIELRDRALNEVVVFVVAKNQPPLELVATRIQHDQIVGYLEIPTPKQ